MDVNFCTFPLAIRGDNVSSVFPFLLRTERRGGEAASSSSAWIDPPPCRYGEKVVSFSGKRSLPIETASTTIDFRLRIHMARPALCWSLHKERKRGWSKKREKKGGGGEEERKKNMGALTVTRETFLIVVVAFQRTRYYTSRVSFSLIHVEGKPRKRESCSPRSITNRRNKASDF